MRVNAKITFIDMDSDSAEITWQTEHNEIIDSFLIRDNYTEFAQRLFAMKLLTKSGLDKKTIYASTFNIRIFFDKDKGTRIAPDSCQLAGDVKYVYVEPSNVTAVTSETVAETGKRPSDKNNVIFPQIIEPKFIIPTSTAKTITPDKTTPTAQSLGRKSFRDKTRASMMGKIGATKLQNKLALKRAQEPIMKLRERIESLKFNCSPAFVETCNQFNSMLNTELRNLEK